MCGPLVDAMRGRAVKPISALARLFSENHRVAQSAGQKEVALGRREGVVAQR
jgi:hypothetical protein